MSESRDKFPTINIQSIKTNNFDLYIQNEAYYPLYGGSSKARKLHFFIEDIKAKGSNAVVTAGSASSNHARVTALACAQYGWDCTIVVHDKPDFSKGNLALMKLAGARLVFVELFEVKEAMDYEMARYKRNGKAPYYIYGGGSGVLGSLAFYEAIKELKACYPNLDLDYLVHPAGTGGTQAGFVVGCNEMFPNTKVVGVSVARNKNRGLEALRQDCKELTKHLDLPPICESKLNFKDEWVGDGYGSTSQDLIEVINKYAKEYGLVTDITYTGKALLGLNAMLNNNEIEKGSSVLFWNTGSLINVLDNKKDLLQ